MTSKWFFGCDSDQHYYYPDLKFPAVCGNDGKGLNPTMNILELHKKYTMDLLLCPGDTTCFGADESKPCLCCCCADKHGNEYEAFMDLYYNPIVASGINTYLCHGNHDVDSNYPRKSLLRFMNQKYGGTLTNDTRTSGYYTFEHKGIQFICMGIYPKDLEWLKQHLPSDTHKPIVIFYHYNTGYGEPFADWWTDTEKNAFYNVISNHNVKLIVNGHWHVTQLDTWKNIPYLLCGANPVAVEVTDQHIMPLM